MTKRPKLTEDEKRWRRHQRRAVKENAKVAAQIPLFAAQVPQRSATDEYWRWRRNVALAAERGNVAGCVGLQRVFHFLDALYLGGLAKRYLTPEQWEAAWAYRQRTYPKGDDWSDTFWRSVLTGKRVVCRLERVATKGEPTKWNVTGERFTVTEHDVIHLDPPLFTVQQLYELMKVPEPLEAPDGDLTDRLGWFLGRPA